MDQGVHGANTAPGAAGLAPAIQAHLGQQLRAVYDDLANQPVPDKFLQLLDALERQHASAAAPAAGRATSAADRATSAAGRAKPAAGKPDDQN